MLLRALLRFVLESLVRLNFPTLAVENLAVVPPRGPVLFVLNHPNALIDPVVLRLVLRRPVRLLAKSTLFGNALGRVALGAFGAIPVYRRQDVGAAGDRAGNERTFALCREALARGEAIALFPEGTSHSDPRLKPLKTGAARIALAAEHAHGGALGLRIVPVGLAYERKSVFRSRALLVFGAPLAAADFLPAYARDAEAGVDALTAAIRDALGTVVLQAETRELLEGVARVAVWTAEDPAARDDLAAQHERARELLAAYQALRARDPARVEAVVAHAQAYAQSLAALGVSDPWALEVGRVTARRAVRALAALAALAPAALLGALLGWVPYRLAGAVARRFFHHEDLLGTVKLLAGALFLLVGWGLEALAAALALRDARAALAVLLVAPVAGYAALRFDELRVVAGAALRHVWLRGTDPETTHALVAHRRALANEVAVALRELGAPPAVPAEPRTASG